LLQYAFSADCNVVIRFGRTTMEEGQGEAAVQPAVKFMLLN
jgi:hypothetical protein